jgi:3-oxoacyl-[acyl-carrier protein] reductase
VNLGLAGRRAIVTGGTKGIGRAVIDELRGEGAQVAFCARNSDDVAATAKELADQDLPPVFAASADVTSATDVSRFIEESAQALGGVDILVNNAGAAHPGSFETLTDDDWCSDVDTKLFSQIRCTRAALPHLRRSTSARVINVNAVYGRCPDPAFFATSVIRAACLSLNKTLAIELAGDGVLVNSVNIGFVVTAQWENIRLRRAPESTPDKFFADLSRDEVPLGRFGTVDEVSGLIAFLASDRGSYITGASIDVAGGMGRYV